MSDSVRGIIEELKLLIAKNYDAIKRLEFEIERVSKGGEKGLGASQTAASAVKQLHSDLSSESPAVHSEQSTPLANPVTVNWIIGPPDNAGWAYGNNAKRLSSLLPTFLHTFSSPEPSDIAVYFDVLVAERFPAQAKRTVVRLGGPRPLDRLYGADRDKLRRGLKQFDAVVALNYSLYRLADDVHDNVFLIPNALDLSEWELPVMSATKSRAFTAGFAGSIKSTIERKVKGYDVAQKAAEVANVQFLAATKGVESQIGHDKMISDFYARCDVLLHVVGAGREGSSNVLMEAMALGVPTITTRDAGLHGELLEDRKSTLFCEQTVESATDALLLLRNDNKLRQRIATSARRFAERNHDIRSAARRYRDLFIELSGAGARVGPGENVSVCFVPFWEPIDRFASSRLRALRPATLLDGSGCVATVGYNEAAKVAVIVQSCDDETLSAITRNVNQAIVYDVCDRYFENPRIFKHRTGAINSQERFYQLCSRADVLLAPSAEMKTTLSRLYPDKVVVFIPEPIDYSGRMIAPTSETAKIVLWFGNPDRGNFASVKWMLDHLVAEHGYTPRIVSRKSFFKKFDEVYPFVEEWSEDAMQRAFAECSICVLGHSDQEQSKSANRLVAAIAHGIPTLVTPSPAFSHVMAMADIRFALMHSTADIDRAIRRLGNPARAANYVKRMQRTISAVHGDEQIRSRYKSLVAGLASGLNSLRGCRIGVISHNLAVGEGAPRSLVELAEGLRDYFHAEIFGYCAAGGPLETLWERKNLPLTVFDSKSNHCFKVLNRNIENAYCHFADFVAKNKIDILICNTVRTSPYVEFGARLGLPAALIIRESFDGAERFASYTGEARVWAEVGVKAASDIIFVSAESKKAWADVRFRGLVHTIPNGIGMKRFSDALALSRDEARLSVNLAREKVVLLCVGTVNARKGQRQLLEWFFQLPATTRDRCHFAIVGATVGAYLDDLRQYLDAATEYDRSIVSLVDATDDVGVWYRAADVLLVNSRSEAYPRCILEGMAFGLPVVSTKVFGAVEQVRDTWSGFLYEFDDQVEWSRRIIELVDSLPLRQSMGMAASAELGSLKSFSEMIFEYGSILSASVKKNRLRTEA